VRCRRDDNIYAIKSIPLQKKKFTYKVNQHGNHQEVEIMSDLEHPNIIRMIASFTGMDFGHEGQSSRDKFIKMSTTIEHNSSNYAS